jgi:hypothetical protein
MFTLANLHSTVQTTLASKRLGKPVFVRYLLQGSDKAEAIPGRLAQLTHVVREWLGQPLERLYAIGSVDSGQVSLTLQFREGATALVTFARGQPRGAGVDLLVVGNRGSIYHDAGSASLWDDAAAALPDRPDPAIKEWIEGALRSGKPEGPKP